MCAMLSCDQIAHLVAGRGINRDSQTDSAPDQSPDEHMAACDGKPADYISSAILAVKFGRKIRLLGVRKEIELRERDFRRGK